MDNNDTLHYTGASVDDKEMDCKLISRKEEYECHDEEESRLVDSCRHSKEEPQHQGEKSVELIKYH